MWLPHWATMWSTSTVPSTTPWAALLLTFYAKYAATIDLVVKAVGVIVLVAAIAVIGIYGAVGTIRVTTWSAWSIVKFIGRSIDLICFVIGISGKDVPGHSNAGDTEDRVTVNHFVGRMIRGNVADGFFIHRRDGLLDVYINVPELIRRFRLVVEIPEAWRIVTIREAILLISERELPREEDGSFMLTNGQRAKGLISAACGILQDDICVDTERASFNCVAVLGCYQLEGLNGCSSCYWNKRNSRCSHRDPDNKEGAPRSPVAERHRHVRNSSSVTLSPVESAGLRALLRREQQRGEVAGS
ncbi:hypothetical protein V496_09699 [Pseudogymnoascus sp. VKM F-4515 (FW-2607)]|nr:hypothetical protein V496_09699 [Pseudogymnoascus sp. VKM F-4515 (FW-2607)]